MKAMTSNLERQAAILLEQGDASGALGVLNRLLDIAREAGDSQLLAHALNLRALALVRLEQFGEAIQLRNEEREIYLERGDREALRRWCCNRALIAHHEDDEACANSLYDELESLGVDDAGMSDVV